MAKRQNNGKEELFGVIPKPPQTSKLKYGITGWDIGVGLLAIVLGLLSAVAPAQMMTNKIGDMAIRAFIAIVVILIVLCPMMPVSSDMRLYKFVWISLAFKWIDKKVYTLDDPIATTRKFNPYKRVNCDSNIDIAKNFLILNNTKSKKENADEELFMCGIEFDGKNIFQQDFVQQEIMIESWWDLIVDSNHDFQIVKLSKMSNRDFNNKHISRLSNLNNKLFKEGKIGLKQFESRRSVIEEYTKKYIYKDTESRTDYLEDRYYFVVYADKEQELVTEINRIMNLINQKGMNAKALSVYENVNLISSVYTPLAEPISPTIIEQNRDDLGAFLAFEKIEFKRNHFKANGLDLYFKTAAVTKFPMHVGIGWLKTLFRSSGSVVLSVNESLISENKFLSSNLMNLKTNRETINQTKVVDIKAMEYEEDVYEHIVADLATGREKLKEMSCMVILSSNDEKGLIEQSIALRAELQKSGLGLDDLLNRQIDGLEHFSLKPYGPLTKSISRHVPAYSIALGYPFISQRMNDINGLYLGVNTLGDQIIYDQWARPEGVTTSHNLMLIGTTGSGKSETIKKIAIWNIVNNVRSHVFDLENEFGNLARNMGEEIVHVGTRDGVINPLQVMATPNDLNQSYLEDDFQAHLSNLETIFKLLYPEEGDYEIGYLVKEISSLYKNTSIIKKAMDERWNLSQLKSKDYPIISDLIEMLKLELKTTVNLNQISMHEKWIHILTQDFMNGGKYEFQLNNHSTLEVGESTFTVYNVKAIFDTPNAKLRDALLQLLFSYVTNKINVLRIENDIEFAKLVKKYEAENHPYPEREAYVGLTKQTVLIDEGHQFMKESDVTLNFISNAVKRFRKYQAGLTFVTQDVNDFLKDGEDAKKTQAILTNTPARLIMLCTSKGLDAVDTLFTQDGGLTDEEKRYILNAGQGRGVFMKNVNNRHCIQVERNQVEKELIWGREDA